MLFDPSEKYHYRIYQMGKYKPKQDTDSVNYSQNLNKAYLLPEETLNKSYIDGSLLGQRVEEFLPSLDGYLNKSLDLVDRMAAEKVALSKLTIGQLVNQLHEREKIKEDNFNVIDYEWCRVYSELMQIEQGSHYNPQYDKHITNLERMLADLDKQKRDETVKFWKDTSDLKKDLTEAFKEYRSAIRREKILGGQLPGYGGENGS